MSSCDRQLIRVGNPARPVGVLAAPLQTGTMRRMRAWPVISAVPPLRP
jgi:hypothetical protein